MNAILHLVVVVWCSCSKNNYDHFNRKIIITGPGFVCCLVGFDHILDPKKKIAYFFKMKKFWKSFWWLIGHWFLNLFFVIFNTNTLLSKKEEKILFPFIIITDMMMMMIITMSFVTNFISIHKYIIIVLCNIIHPLLKLCEKKRPNNIYKADEFFFSFVKWKFQKSKTKNCLVKWMLHTHIISLVFYTIHINR